MNVEQALGIVRSMVGNGVNQEDAITNQVIPKEFQDQIREVLKRDENIILEPPRVLVASGEAKEWLQRMDRSSWYYWPQLRTYLLSLNKWSLPSVRGLDENTDRILSQLADPATERFDIKGLTIGFVQSGKTANYTALIAKAADVGYRLIIVLSGIDNGLRRQTQMRLNSELVGYADNRRKAVPLPPMGQQWHSFTTEEIDGDFRAGNANYAALQGTQPVLLVVKKNGSVLRRLHTWLDEAPEHIRKILPVLIIDDEADQASVDTRGSYQAENEPIPEDYEEPSVINGLIRDLLRKFQRRAYVAYTATPFANILIPHDAFDPRVENDLYPKDFIVDLPRPEGYFGAEELFGRLDSVTGEEIGGLDIVEPIPETDFKELRDGLFPSSLETALIDFVLAGAGRAQRGQENAASTMLLHGSHLILAQQELTKLVGSRYSELRDEWRYQRGKGIVRRMRDRWNEEFRPLTRSLNPANDVAFEKIEKHISPFFESVEVREINSRTGEVLDYETDPDLAAIAIGGNRLSRGLTLEGLLVSYFFRSSATYDTLMQMGRWFGFRSGYEDLTRIYMTPNISGWFSDLAMVEHELREDIRSYEANNVTPLELGVRIVKHPAMLVTSRLKQRHARSIIVEQSYSNQVLQTFRFPFSRKADLHEILAHNFSSTRSFLAELDQPNWEQTGPVWNRIKPDQIINFVSRYRNDPDVRNISIPLLTAYIERQNQIGELTNWTVAVRGREKEHKILGSIDLGIARSIPKISRNRLAGDPDSLGVITNPGDEAIGFSRQELDRLAHLQANPKTSLGLNPAARSIRSPQNGLLIIYPLSKHSGHETPPRQSRKPMFEDPDDDFSADVIAFALSFPPSLNAKVVIGEYILGTVDWKAA